jgi:chromosome segregation ATPase
MSEIRRWKPRSIELTERQREIAELEAKLDAANAEVGRLNLECVNLERQLGLQTEELDAANAEIEQLKAQLITAEKRGKGRVFTAVP